MATLYELERDHVLWKLDPGLPQYVQLNRMIYALERAKNWLVTSLPTVVSAEPRNLTPAEQFVALLERFCSGGELLYEVMFRDLKPLEKGVWELKTYDVRVFGFFHCEDCFVAVVADSADRVKAHDLYAGYIDEVVRARDDLPLDEPKCLFGEEPDAVVSNCRRAAP